MEGVRMDEPFYDVVEYLPPNFWNKTKNEPFIQKLMSLIIPETTWEPGNPDKSEPDYYCNGVPFEFTIASDSKKKNNFVQRIQRHTYSTENLGEDFFRYIRERIADKATRKYSGHNVHLCVLCLLDLTDWVLDQYGSVTYEVADWPRRNFFDEIKQTYITTKIFANIFILFPDCQAKWWIWDVGTDHRASVRLDERSLASGEYPYCILKPPSPDSNTTGSG